MFGTGDGHTVGCEYLYPSLCKSYIVGRCSQCHSTAHTAPVMAGSAVMGNTKKQEKTFVNFHMTVSAVVN